MRGTVLGLFIFISSTILAQENEDFEYELEHKSQSWFSDMKDGANYFQVKNCFDSCFASKRWEKSKPRSLGEDWLKTKIFYLDKNGVVQDEPKLKGTNDLITLSTTEINSWNLLGPVNSATTNYSGQGSHGGYVFLNRIDPTNPLKRFVSFVTGGLWMTSDGGVNWILVDANMPDDAYLDLDVAVSNPQVVYAISNQQVIKSLDGGQTWKSTSLTNLNYTGTAYDLAVSTNNPNIVVVRWGSEIYRTIDGGTSWTSVQNGLANHNTWDSSIHSEMLDWSTTNNNVVYSVSTSHNNQVIVHRSIDAGAKFSLFTTLTLDPSANGQIVGWAKLMLPTTNANSIYVAVGSGSDSYAHRAVHLYKINATSGMLENLKTNMINGIGDTYNHDPVLHHGDICMDRNNEKNIAWGTYGDFQIHVSSDTGSTFILGSGKTHYDIRTVDFVNNLLLIGSDGESVSSTDKGETLTTVTNSISNHELWGFGSAFKSSLVASGNNHGPAMIKESANGFDWYNGPGADQGNTDVNPLDDRYVYSQGFSNYRYFRTGVHKLINESNYLDLGGIYSYFNSIEFHPNYYYTIITHHAGQYPADNPKLSTWKNSLIKTEDNGNSISVVKTFENQVFREKISMKNPNYMYVVEGLNNNKLWYTSDAGKTWTNITPSLSASLNQTNISDIAVSDEHPNEVWVTYSGVQTSCKVLKSSDYGKTWVNLTQSTLSSFPITKIIFQRGSNGGVYIGNKSGVFYRNNSMSNWMVLGAGLPMCEIRFMFINYNENKLKIGTSRGAFSNDLYEISPPNALISASVSKIICPSVETVQFKDYSVVRNNSAKWLWSFPGGTPSSSTEENPIVSYKGAADGFYSATLTVTDDYGTSTQTLSKVIEIKSQCGSSSIDSIPGNIALLSGATNDDYLEVKNLNIAKNSFTFSCWIKPLEIQEDYSAIFNTQDTNSVLALNFLGGNNTIGYHPNYWWSSGLQAPANKWSHIAMVSNGTDLRIYVNGVESIHKTSLPSEIFSAIDLGRYGRGYTSRYTNLEMDEVCIWNRPLSKDEIRAWMHLCKTNPSHTISSGLVAYFQFNEPGGNVSLNKMNNSNYLVYKGTSGMNHKVSNAPVFYGDSQKKNISSAGSFNFDSTGVSMVFNGGIYPNGDIWVSRAYINPDVQPDLVTNFNSYTIIENYGTNKSFTPLASISFTGNKKYLNTQASFYNLYKRGSNDFGNTWGEKIGVGDNISGSSGLTTKITFSSGINISSLSQFAITNDNLTVSVPKEVKTDNEAPNVYTNPISIGNSLTVNMPEQWGLSTMVIFDIQGNKISQSTLTSGDNKVLVNFSPGVYSVLIFNQTKNYSKKIIVN